MDENKYVVQEYIRDPYLIDGLKFDIRLYVLILGSDPMKVYLYQEGLVRFATEPYNKDDSNWDLENMYVHLTNYSVNKMSQKFFIANDPN